MATPTTTYKTIRDQWISVVQDLTPTTGAQPFALFTEQPRDFRRWVEDAKVSSLRKFIVRRSGIREPAVVTDNAKEQITAEAELVVAYPRAFGEYSRAASRRNILDLEDMALEDAEQIGTAIGIAGYVNYVSGQSWTSATYEIEDGDEAVFLVVNLSTIFKRAIGAPVDAMQNSAEQSFQYTTIAASDSHAIVFPVAMADATYTAETEIVYVPSGPETGVWADNASRTAVGCTLKTLVEVPIGTLIDVHLRDRQ